MPKKRRNNGRNKKGRGNTRNLACDNCRKLVPKVKTSFKYLTKLIFPKKDKAIKRYVVRDLFDGSTKSDINDNKAVESNTLLIPTFSSLYLSDRRPKTFHQIAVLRLMRHSQENREGQINWRQEIQRST